MSFYFVYRFFSTSFFIPFIAFVLFLILKKIVKNCPHSINSYTAEIMFYRENFLLTLFDFINFRDFIYLIDFIDIIDFTQFYYFLYLYENKPSYQCHHLICIFYTNIVSANSMQFYVELFSSYVSSFFHQRKHQQIFYFSTF